MLCQQILKIDGVKLAKYSFLALVTCNILRFYVEQIVFLLGKQT